MVTAVGLGTLLGGMLLLASTAGASLHRPLMPGSIGHRLADLHDPLAMSGDAFGTNDAVAVSGNTAAVGAYHSSGGGAAYIYQRSTSGWPTTPTVTLPTCTNPPSCSHQGVWFGISVALSGNTLVVGADAACNGYNPEWVFVYEKSASGWPTTPNVTWGNPRGTLGDCFGATVAVSASTIVVGDPGTAAYIYQKGTSGWPTSPTVTLQPPTCCSHFGEAVGVSGATALVSDPGYNASTGAVYLYVKGASGWPTSPVSTLSDPAATSNDGFGSSVSVSGTTAIVGAPGYNSNAGAAYIYVEGSSGWPTLPTASLHDPTATSNDAFGAAAAVSAGSSLSAAVVGAPGHNSSAGAAYIYVEGSSGWPTLPTASLRDPTTTSSDDFGDAADVSPTNAVFGAHGYKSSSGAAYIYSV